MSVDFDLAFWNRCSTLQNALAGILNSSRALHQEHVMFMCLVLVMLNINHICLVVCLASPLQNCVAISLWINKYLGRDTLMLYKHSLYHNMWGCLFWHPLMSYYWVLQLSCWPKGPHGNPQTTPAVVKAVGCTPQANVRLHCWRQYLHSTLNMEKSNWF